VEGIAFLAMYDEEELRLKAWALKWGTCTPPPGVKEAYLKY